MNYRKPITAAVIVAGLLAGSAGIAAAGEGRGGGEDKTSISKSEGKRQGPKWFYAAAEFLEMEPDALRAQVEDGETVAEIAASKGYSVEDVVDALIVNFEEKMAEKVEAGDLTQEEADTKVTERRECLTDKVNGVEREARDPEAEEV